MPHQLNATPRRPITDPPRGAKQPLTRVAAVRRPRHPSTASAPSSAHRSAGRPAAATVMPAPTRRIPRGGAGSPPAGSEGRVRRARATPTPCLAHGWHKRVHCRGSPRRNAAQDMATGISSDEALWAPCAAGT
nr:unnamed protein product [Leishmania braziliensis]